MAYSHSSYNNTPRNLFHDANDASNSIMKPCFFLASPFARHHHDDLEKIKDRIAQLALTEDPLSHQRLVPLVQIVDLETSSRPLLLLQWVEALLQACQQKKQGFSCTFTIRETNSSVAVYLGPTEDPSFDLTITAKDPTAAYQACLSQDQSAFLQAYWNGLIDIDGDLMQCLVCFQDIWWNSSSVNRKEQRWLPWTAIRKQSHHCAITSREGEDTPQTSAQRLAYDTDFHLESPGMYYYDEEDMEPAAQRKLAFVYDQLQLHRDASVLDIGCGWGGFATYAAAKGCLVTALAKSQLQADYVAQQLQRRNLMATVLCQDVFSYKPMFHNQYQHQTLSNTPPTMNTTTITSTPDSLQESLRGSIRSASSSQRRRHYHHKYPQRPHQSHRQMFDTFSSPDPHLQYSASPTPLTLQSPPRIPHLSHHPSPMTPLDNMSSHGADVTTASSTAGAGPILFDAIAMMAVLEELGSDYPHILSTLSSLIRPGGRIYLDFAAGYHRPNWIALPNFLQAVEESSSLVLEALWDNRHQYHLWAYKAYQKLATKNDEFVAQLRQEKETGASHHSSDNDTVPSATGSSEQQQHLAERNVVVDHKNFIFQSNTTTPPRAITSDPVVSKGPGKTRSNRHARGNADDENEKLHRTLLTNLAETAAAMIQPDHHQATAYRMVLKLPETGIRKSG